MQTKRLQRYHITLGNRRTTVSINSTLTFYLALKLNKDPEADPEAPEAHRAIQQWLQTQMDESRDIDRSQISQWLQTQIIHAIVDKKLSKQYEQWLDSQL